MTEEKEHIATRKMKMANSILIPEVIKMIDDGHSVTLPLKGYSMRPFLEDGRDKALLVKPAKELEVGDVVLAEIAPLHFVLHRIIDITEKGIVLRGDGNLANEYCSESNVKALATAFYRKGRKTADSTDGKKWKIYSWWWMRLYPIRRYLLFIYRKCFL